MMSEPPSSTSPTPQRDSASVFLLDENLSSSDIAIFLRRLRDWTIELHTDHFQRGMNDVDLIRECGARGWALITCDDRIRYVPESKAAVLEHRVRAFMFGKGNYQGVEYAAALIIGRPTMSKIIRTVPAPFIARVARDGDIGVIHPQQSTKNLTARDKTERKYGRR